MYSITLSDGTVVENLELNGNNFIADKVIDSSLFEGKLNPMHISDGTTAETHKDWVLLSNIVHDGRSWLVFGEKSEGEKQAEKITDLQMALAEVYEMIIGA